MWRTRTSLLLLLACAGASGGAPRPAAAQEEPAPVVYQREVFRYDRSGRPDPFRSLLTAEELGYRVEDMQLTGVIFSPDARRSVAVLSDAVSGRRFRLRVGERIGGITVTSIQPRRVDLVVNEFGVVRRESLQLKRPEPSRGAEEGVGAPGRAAPAQTEAQKGRGR